MKRELSSHSMATVSSEPSSPMTETDLGLADLKDLEHGSDVPIKPLQKSEVWAWYIQNATYCGFGWVASALMIPLLVQDMASKAGVQANNHAIPCDVSVPGFQCVTSVFGHYLDPGAISLYISSLSSILSFLMSLSIAAVADHGAYRKNLLVVTSILGGLVTIGFFLIYKPSLFWIAAILSPVGWALFNVCGVFSHAFLPIYGRVHPNVLAARARSESSEVIRKIEEQAINDISAYSCGIANLGSMIIHAVCIGVSVGMKETTLSLQIAIAFTGVWWILWTLLVVVPFLDPRPLEPLPKGTNWVVYSWGKTYDTLRSFKKLGQLFKYMIAWFILSDGINTILATVNIILYRELNFDHTHSLILSVLLSTMAMLGSFGFLYIRKIWTLSTKFMIMICLSLYASLLAYLTFIPYFTTGFGLRHAWEGWAIIIYVGLIISTFYGCCRCMLSELCPEGDENEWFGLYLLADKGSSWVGPFITGWIQSLTGEYRRAFWFPLISIAIGVVLLWSVDMRKGKEEAIQFAKEKREQAKAREAFGTGHQEIDYSR